MTSKQVLIDSKGILKMWYDKSNDTCMYIHAVYFTCEASINDLSLVGTSKQIQPLNWYQIDKGP